MSKWDTVQVSPDTMHYKLDIKTDSRDDTKVGLLYTYDQEGSMHHVSMTTIPDLENLYFQIGAYLQDEEQGND